MVKNPPSYAGDMVLIPGRGTKIPLAAGQLSPHATTTELARLNERAHVPRTTEPTHSGARAPQLERSPQRNEKILHAATKTRCSQKNKEKNKREAHLSYKMWELKTKFLWQRNK